jgi:uncharacterized membrane protein YtjA (UPF0391 family)
MLRLAASFGIFAISSPDCLCGTSRTGSAFYRRKLPAENHLEDTMLRWAIIFFIISLITGVLGFTGISEATAGIAKVLFFIFLIILGIWIILILAGISIVT